MKWMSAEELATVHARVLDATGGLQGILSPGAAESAILRPFTTFGGQELFPSLSAKVAALVHSLIAFHPFADGNKRTALVSADVCLRLNGYRLVPGHAVEEFFWSIARGEQTVESITNWLENHIEPWPNDAGGERS